MPISSRTGQDELTGVDVKAGAFSAGLPGWGAFALGPVIALICWSAAYAVASQRGAPSGDTSFAWLPLFPIIIGVYWAAAVAVLLAVRLLVARFWANGRWLVSGMATAIHLVAVAAIFAATFQAMNVPDGWPRDPVAVTAAVAACLASLAQVRWLWVTPTRA